MKPIHLGRSETALSPISAPVGANGEKLPAKKVVHYPSFHVHGDEKEMGDLSKLPEKGVMHVHYHVHSHEVRHEEGGKGKRHSMEIKVHKIVHAAPHKKDQSGEEALNSLAKSVKGAGTDSDGDYDND